MASFTCPWSILVSLFRTPRQSDHNHPQPRKRGTRPLSTVERERHSKQLRTEGCLAQTGQKRRPEYEGPPAVHRGSKGQAQTVAQAATQEPSVKTSVQHSQSEELWPQLASVEWHSLQPKWLEEARQASLLHTNRGEGSGDLWPTTRQKKSNHSKWPTLRDEHACMLEAQTAGPTGSIWINWA